MCDKDFNARSKRANDTFLISYSRLCGLLREHYQLNKQACKARDVHSFSDELVAVVVVEILEGRRTTLLSSDRLRLLQTTYAVWIGALCDQRILREERRQQLSTR